MKQFPLLLLLTISFITSCEKDVDIAETQPITIEEQSTQNADAESINLIRDYPIVENISAIEWNNQGFEAYEKGNFIDAATLFTRSIAADSSYLYAHYNLACTLSLLFESGVINDYNEIIEELQICIALDPKSITLDESWSYNRIREDSDLEAIRQIFDIESLGDYKMWKNKAMNAELDKIMEDKNISLLTALLQSQDPYYSEEILDLAISTNNDSILRLVLGWPGLIKIENEIISKGKIELLENKNIQTYNLFANLIEPGEIILEPLKAEKALLEMIKRAYHSNNELQYDDKFFVVKNFPNMIATEDVEILNPIKTDEGELIFIRTDSIQYFENIKSLSNGEWEHFYAVQGIFCKEEDFSELLSITNEDLSMFGDVISIESLRKEIYLIAIDSFGNEYIYFLDFYLRGTISNKLIVSLLHSDNENIVCSIEYNDFVSGWFVTVTPVAINRYEIQKGDSLVIDSEYLGGPEERSSFSDPFIVEGSVAVEETDTDGNINYITLLQFDTPY